MKKSWFAVCLLLIVLTIGCSFSTANISSATLAKDEAGETPTTTFGQEDTFYAVVEVANAPDDTKVKAVWTGVEIDGQEPNFVIGEKELTGGGTVNFSLSNDQLWPTGTYKVDIYLNGELDRTLDFEVEGDVAAVQEPEPTPEPEPSPTPEPEPSPTTEPTVEPTVEPTEEATTEPTEEATTEPTEEGVIFAEMFDSAENGWETGAFEHDYGTTEVTIEQGVYTLSVEATDSVYDEETLPEAEFGDFMLTVEVTPADAEANYAFGVALRRDSDANRYVFEVANDGFYNIALFNGEWQTLKDWTETTDIVKPGETNELMVVATGEVLAFYVNGEPLTALEDATSTAGQVGLVLEVFEADTSATVVYDNLVIRELSDDIELPEIETPSVVETLPFREEPYSHPSGAFSFNVPEAWDLVVEDETRAVVGADDGAVGVIFGDIGTVYDEAGMQAFMDSFIQSFTEAVATDYEVVSQETQADDSIYVVVDYQADDGDGRIDFFFEQRQTVIFVLYFLSTNYDALAPTWGEIVSSYTVDPEAALAAAPAPLPTPVPVPTEPPPPPPGPSVPAGKGMMLFRNNTGVDFVIDVIGPTNTSQVIPPQSSFEFILDPGQYTINGHSPGGEYAINAYSFEIVEGRIFPLDLN